jgi:hypothetical protein
MGKKPQKHREPVGSEGSEVERIVEDLNERAHVLFSLKKPPKDVLWYLA